MNYLKELKKCQEELAEHKRRVDCPCMCRDFCLLESVQQTLARTEEELTRYQKMYGKPNWDYLKRTGGGNEY